MKKFRFQINGTILFILLLMLSVTLSFLFPDPGMKGGILHTEYTTRIAVFIIFIIQGMTLPSKELLQGLAKFKVHISIQAFIFLFLPAFVYVCLLFTRNLFPFDLVIGFLFLAIVPTTISSSVVFSTQAGGSNSIALFNASLSNILGIFFVPLWISWQLGGKVNIPPAGDLILKIMVIILLPFIIGQILRNWLAWWADPRKKKLGNLSMMLILFIVYAAFCASVKDNTWGNLGIEEIGLIFISTLILLILVMIAGRLCWKYLRFDRKEGIAFFFGATQKALSTGIPMGHAIFASTGLDLALILVPLMLYHPLQLLLGSIIVGRLAKNKT